MKSLRSFQLAVVLWALSCLTPIHAMSHGGHGMARPPTTTSLVIAEPFGSSNYSTSAIPPTDHLVLELYRRQAQAAELQAWFAVIGTLVSTLGLYGLYKTFKETRRNADGAIEGARTAQKTFDRVEAKDRPVLAMHTDEPRSREYAQRFMAYFHESGMYHHVLITLEPEAKIYFYNYGNQPAVIDKILAAVDFFRGPPPLNKIVQQNFLNKITVIRPSESSTVLEIEVQPDWKEIQNSYQLIDDVKNGIYSFWLYGIVYYRGIGPESKNFETEFLYRYEQNLPEKNGLFPYNVGECAKRNEIR